MSEELAGRVALVTGGSRGVGAAVVRDLAARGATVAFTYRRRAEEADQVESAAAREGRTAIGFQGSIDDAARMEQVVQDVAARLGVIDLLVSNAGTASSGNSVAESSIDEFHRLMTVHTWGPLQLVQCLLPGMRLRPRGDIILVSSVTTDSAPSCAAPYTMAKAAMEMAVRTVAREERAFGIRANIVAPGLVDTDMGARLVAATQEGRTIGDLSAMAPFGRVCCPQDVANVVGALVGPAGEYVTGQRVVVDGGGPQMSVLTGE